MIKEKLDTENSVTFKIEGKLIEKWKLNEMMNLMKTEKKLNLLLVNLILSITFQDTDTIKKSTGKNAKARLTRQWKLHFQLGLGACEGNLPEYRFITEVCIQNGVGGMEDLDNHYHHYHLEHLYLCDHGSHHADLGNQCLHPFQECRNN